MEKLFSKDQLVEMVNQRIWDVLNTTELSIKTLARRMSIGTSGKNKIQLVAMIKKLDEIRFSELSK